MISTEELKKQMRELRESVQALTAENAAMRSTLAGLLEPKPINHDLNGKPIIRTEEAFNFGRPLFEESRPGESQQAKALMEKIFEIGKLTVEVAALKQEIKDLVEPYHEGCPTTARLTNAAIATYARWAQKEISALKAFSFQSRVHPWLLNCFGEEIASDSIERNHRFLEEALELVQSCGGTRSEAHQLVDYVFNRQVGEKSQEVGGVMVTLAALCLAQNMDMHDAGEIELARIWTKVEKIREKQAAKPKLGPLPM